MTDLNCACMSAWTCFIKTKIMTVNSGYLDLELDFENASWCNSAIHYLISTICHYILNLKTSVCYFWILNCFFFESAPNLSRPEDIDKPIFTQSKRHILAKENQHHVMNGKMPDRRACVLGEGAGVQLVPPTCSFNCLLLIFNYLLFKSYSRSHMVKSNVTSATESTGEPPQRSEQRSNWQISISGESHTCN